MAGESISDDTTLYVIGDIHGRLDLLDRLIADITADAAANGGETLTVTLGDYVDRGPHSRGVLDRLAGNPFPGRYVPLKGNHEALFEGFMAEPHSGAHWRKLGGLETLHSYGVPVAPLMLGKNFDVAARQLQEVLPPSHAQFLASLKTSLDAGRYFLCHAGIRPGVPFARQREDDLLWIREEFLASSMNFGKVVVHGHTPAERPEVLPNRINIDTGAFATGRLTCVVLEKDRHRFLTTA